MARKDKKRILLPVALVPIIVLLALFVWFIFFCFEGEKPVITLQPRPEFLAKHQKFTITVVDKKRGLRRIRVSLNQEGREVTVFEKKFPFEGLLNRQGVHRFEKQLSIDPSAINLAQGRVELQVQTWDFSRRRGGDGNLALIQHKMMVDTIPPSIRAVSRMHNINMGGSCLVVYQASSDTRKSGVLVNDVFFPGFPAGGSQKGIHLSYFALPYGTKPEPSIYLWAVDKAGNESKGSFYYHVLKKRFRKDKINISDRFLARVMPYFSFYPFDPQMNDLQKYITVNNQLRKKNHQTIEGLKSKTSPDMLWKGTWVSLKNAATMSRFGDRRSYYYKGKKIDEQVHLGVDLASLANSPVPAANTGRVIFADRLGIYGLAVVLDHGQGLASLYGHLSELGVKPGQDVSRGETIGHTGQTGLAGGDHLHFSVMVNGVFVNPIEWWDGHWIKDNITRKRALFDKIP
jgi:murein DD-endopeptidase MepM/ murein hydrolase activator NlpD